MRKLSVILALVLCAVLCVFCFASCGKKSGTEQTTANETTPAATEAKTEAATEAKTEAATEPATVPATEKSTEPATDAATEPATEPATDKATEPATVPTGCVHEWDEGEENYVVDEEPDCFNEGSKSFHCKLCGKPVPETVVILPKKHVPEKEYEIETEPTCCTDGLKILYCAECGDPIEEVLIEADPDAHKVDNWEVSKQPTLLDPTGHRSGVCKYCEEPLEEELTFKHNVQVFTTSSGKYSAGHATLGEIRGDEHFYATDDHINGLDLLVEYSFLWNDTLLNLYNINGTMPAVDTRFATTESGSTGNMGIVRLELAENTTSQWCICKYAGGFTAYGTSEPDNPYPRFEETVMDATAYPNIGGANLGDGQPLGDTQWGWHRVSIRFHEEVTNIDEVKEGAAATYYIQLWVYIDGDLVIHTSGTDHRWGGDGSDRKLYSVKSDEEGGVIYTENDNLYLHGAFLDSRKMNSDVGYFEIADYSAKIGDGKDDFVQQVRKVQNPTLTTFEVEEGVSLPSTMWYELAD